MICRKYKQQIAELEATELDLRKIIDEQSERLAELGKKHRARAAELMALRTRVAALEESIERGKRIHCEAMQTANAKIEKQQRTIQESRSVFLCISKQLSDCGNSLESPVLNEKKESLRN